VKEGASIIKAETTANHRPDIERRGCRPAGLNSESSSAFAENTSSIQCSANVRAPTLASRVMTLASPDVG
jgi:hypothetical protein